MRRRCAALETVPSSATVTNVRMCLRSIAILMPNCYGCPEELSIGRASLIASQLLHEFRFATNPVKEEIMKPVYLTLLPLFGIGLVTIEAAAETWPTKPLRAIVPVGAGSTTDIIPRVVFEQLSVQLGQSIVVENRVGAGGTIGSAFVAKAEPD